MKSIFLISTFALGVFLVASSFVGLGDGQEEFKEYESDLLGIKLSFPAEWEDVMTEETLDTFNDGDESYRISFDVPFTKDGTVTILVKESEVDSLSKLKTKQISSATMFGDVDIIDIGSTAFADNDGAEILYTRDNENKIMQVVSLIDDQSYSFVYRTNIDKFDEYLPIAEQILNSIQLINN